MIRVEHIGAARAFRDLGFSEEQVKLAFSKQGMSGEDTDMLVKEAFGAAIAGVGRAIGTKFVPWLAKMFGSKASGAAGGMLTKGLSSGGPIRQGAGNFLHNFGQAAQGSAHSFSKAPVRSMGGGAVNFVKGNLFMDSAKPSAANWFGKAKAYEGMGRMAMGPGESPMPTPQHGSN